MVTTPSEAIAIASVSEAEPIFPPFEITREPPLIAPVVVIVDEPVSKVKMDDGQFGYLVKVFLTINTEDWDQNHTNPNILPSQDGL